MCFILDKIFFIVFPSNQFTIHFSVFATAGLKIDSYIPTLEIESSENVVAPRMLNIITQVHSASS